MLRDKRTFLDACSDTYEISICRGSYSFLKLQSCLKHLFVRVMNGILIIAGTKVVHQSPPGCIVPEPGVDRARLFDFETMAEYIIPKQAFCNRYVTVCDPEHKYRILGHPVCITDEKYERNEFMFNFCIVINTEDNKIPFESVIRRLASTFTEMEIQNEFLSKEAPFNTTERRSISALIEIIREDLNTVDECMIPVGQYLCPLFTCQS